MEDIQGGARNCMPKQANGVNVPGYHLTGTPTNGIPKLFSDAIGEAAPLGGGNALCCVP